MDLMEAVRTRHSVRAYTDKKIETETLAQLQEMVVHCNRESGLQIQLCTEDPNAFEGFLARYGRFQNVRNYIAIVGEKGRDFEETGGYYGEKVVLKAQQLGLNTCWVAMTYKKGQVKKTVKIGAHEELLMVIALGYGATAGEPHKSKPLEDLCKGGNDGPDWFCRGVAAAQLAPTAINQQKFVFIRNGNQVKALAGFGPHTKVDLGIAKYHFEIGAGAANWQWED